MGKSAPKPVDFEAAALAEGEKAREVTEAQTWANRPTQINPWGRVDWWNEPVWDSSTNQYINQWTQNTSLTPGLQEALDSQIGMQAGRSKIAEGMLGDINAAYQNPVDWSQFGGMMAPDTANVPDLWSHLQWDIPQYSTTGTVRQLDYSGLPQVDTPEFTNQRAENSYYDRVSNRLNQQFGSERQALEIKLRNQGLSPGDEAYQAQMAAQDRKENDAYMNAQNEAIMHGGQEAQRMFDMQTGRRGMFAGELMDLGGFANNASNQEFIQNLQAGKQGFMDTLSAAQFQNQARNQMLGDNYRQADYYNKMREQAINEMITQRGYTLNEAMALLSGQQVGMPSFTGFSNATKADTPQLLNAANLTGQQSSAIASMENAQMEALMGGIGSAVGMTGMFSDRRLKSNIKKIGERNGVNWYSYTIFGRQQIGVMADEVPWAATEHPSGFMTVDYSKV